MSSDRGGKEHNLEHVKDDVFMGAGRQGAAVCQA